MSVMLSLNFGVAPTFHVKDSPRLQLLSVTLVNGVFAKPAWNPIPNGASPTPMVPAIFRPLGMMIVVIQFPFPV